MLTRRLRDVRLFFQAATEQHFKGAVSAIVGRPVESFMSAIDTHTDTAIEVFIFAPDEERDDSSAS
jgi:uncharacterized protein YbcI